MKGNFIVEIEAEGIGTDIAQWAVKPAIKDALELALVNWVPEGVTVKVNVEGPFDVETTTAWGMYTLKPITPATV